MTGRITKGSDDAYGTTRLNDPGAKISRAGRWFASSQIHHGCGCRLIAPTRMAKQLVCRLTGEVVDRDKNAAKNLRDWPETQASSGLVEASAPVDTRARQRWRYRPRLGPWDDPRPSG